MERIRKKERNKERRKETDCILKDNKIKSFGKNKKETNEQRKKKKLQIDNRQFNRQFGNN